MYILPQVKIFGEINSKQNYVHRKSISETSVHKADETPALRRLLGDAEINVKLHAILPGMDGEEGGAGSTGACRESDGVNREESEVFLPGCPETGTDMCIFKRGGL